MATTDTTMSDLNRRELMNEIFESMILEIQTGGNLAMRELLTQEG
jgi:hypothetical protein